jgi:hypothetical protein
MSKIKETLDKLYQLWGELPEIEIEEDILHFENRSQLILDDARDFKPVIELLTSLIQTKNSQVLDLYIWNKGFEVFYCNKVVKIPCVLNFSNYEDNIPRIHIPLVLYPFFKKFFSWKREVRVYATDVGIYLFMVEQPKTKTKEENLLRYFIPKSPSNCIGLLQDYESLTRHLNDYINVEKMSLNSVSYEIHTIKTLEEM